MTTYLLDTNVLSYFLNTGNEDPLAECATNIGLATVGQVREELAGAQGVGRRYQAWLAAARIEVIDIVLGSPEHALLAQLQLGVTTHRGRGERECIAVAALRWDLVFVANDKNAMWLALRELHAPGERLLGLAVFLRRLVEAGLSPAVANDVLSAAGMAPPTWWQEVMAGR